jgi:hypothetical protein
MSEEKNCVDEKKTSSEKLQAMYRFVKEEKLDRKWEMGKQNFVFVNATAFLSLLLLSQRYKGCCGLDE